MSYPPYHIFHLTHGPVESIETTTCPYCHRVYSKKYIQTHLEKAHQKELK